MNGPITYIKQHPYVAGAVGLIVGGGILYILFSNSGGASDSVAPIQFSTASDPNSVGAGLALQQLNQQSAATTAKIAADREVALAEIAANAEKTKQENLTSYHLADLTAHTRQAEIASQNRESTMTARTTAQKNLEAFRLEQQKVSLLRAKEHDDYIIQVRKLGQQFGPGKTKPVVTKPKKPVVPVKPKKPVVPVKPKKPQQPTKH